MRTVYVRLPNIQAVQEFVNTLAPLKGRFDLVSGHYLLDARSLMGIVSLDLSKPIRLDMSEDTPENMRAIQRFIDKDTDKEV